VREENEGGVREQVVDIDRKERKEKGERRQREKERESDREISG
jgi:hypothetical protein